MFERILLPLDGSELAETALPYAEELSKKLGSELVLFHVTSPEDGQHERVHRLYLDGLAANIAKRLEESGGRGRVTVQIVNGQPLESICGIVEKSSIDLIVMTSIGATGSKVDKLLGGVADGVCRSARSPVMLIRPENAVRTASEGPAIRRMLVTLDGSELSKQALPLAEDLAGRLAIPIVLFQMAHVISPYGGEPAPFIDYTKLTDDQEKRVRAEMVDLEKKLRDEGLNAAWSATSGTDAAQEIIKVSEGSGADLVVMSTHGRGGLRRWIFGSVAEKVLRYGHANLLLVHPR